MRVGVSLSRSPPRLTGWVMSSASLISEVRYVLACLVQRRSRPIGNWQAHLQPPRYADGPLPEAAVFVREPAC